MYNFVKNIPYHLLFFENKLTGCDKLCPRYPIKRRDSP